MRYVPRISQTNVLRSLTLTDLEKLNFPKLPETRPEDEALDDEQVLRDLHRFLLETQVTEGKLICGNCSHEYMIKEGIANFLLPSHLGWSSALCLA